MIHIYYTNLNGDCSYEQSLILYGFLPPERQEQVRNAKREDVAKKRLYTGAFLQYALSSETGIPMEYIAYTYGNQGKPEIDYLKLEKLLKSDTINIEEKISRRFHFNLSHSGDYAVLAISDSPVGIDIEYKKNHYEAVAKRCFCQEEYEDIMAVEDIGERQRRFLQYWTMKEAYIKYTGEGLSIPLNSFQIIRQENNLFCVRDREVWFGSMLWGDKPYTISLCGNRENAVRFERQDKKSDAAITEIRIGNITHRR